MTTPPPHRALPVALAVLALVGGALAAVHYHHLGLTLSHYDARGHLIVARRIFDNITPGWRQIGAVWLPLPHLLNAIPVQVDAWYRSGASAVAISVLSYALAVGSMTWLVLALTGCAPAAVAGAAVFALNPNVVYLQATPMTEPLLLGLTTLAVALLLNWCRKADPAPRSVWPGLAFALACLTRYEAWPVTAVALAAAVWTLVRGGVPLAPAIRRVAAIAVYPAAAIVGFMIFSRIVIGQWFVASGFFDPTNKALNAPLVAASEIAWGVNVLTGPLLVGAAVAGAAALAVFGVAVRRRAESLIALSLAATAALPWAAFVKGHPFRVRYMVPLVAIEAVAAGAAAGLLPRARLRALGAAIVVALVAVELRPLELTAPMVVEAQWDRPNMAVRDRVTACLGPPGSGDKIMASMGSLGHYMQQTSHQGFYLRDFLHEGNGELWQAALANGPRAYAKWVLIEEKAEGGDMLAQIVRRRPEFLDGYVRVCEGAGMALYEREEP